MPKEKNCFIKKDFIYSIKKAFSGNKAERLPESSHYPLYIGDDLMEQMKTADNQIIWGRRGTGKTHLLKAFNQYINDDPDYAALSYYISCDTIKFESPISLNFEDDIQKMKYCARETFKLFMDNLIEQIINTYEKNIRSKYFFGDKTFDEQETIRENVDKFLTELLSNIKEGTPKSIEVNSLESQVIKSGIKKNVQTNLNGKMSDSAHNIGFEFGTHNNKELEDNVESKKDQKFKYDFSFQEFHKSFSKLMDVFCLDVLYICIDELWLMDEKSMLSFQPLFLDYLKQTLFSIPKISIKIASIRETTKLNSKNNMVNNFGLQPGHDIIELANLDSMQYSNEELLKKFTDILWARINYFSEEFQNSISPEIYTKEYIIETLFKNSRYFDILISLAHGIPRNVLYALRIALNGINYNLSEFFLHIYYLSEVIISIYNNEKRANMPMNENSVYSTITNYVNKYDSIFFLLSNEHVKQYSSEINNLIYVEIIHRIPSSLTPNNIMDQYKAYFVDTGKFLSVLKEKNLEHYRKRISDFELTIPTNLASNYNEYIIDLDNIPNNFIECPNCSATFNINHPVYVKFHCCVTCGLEFEGKTIPCNLRT